MNEFKDHAALQAHLDRLKSPVVRELTLSFDRARLYTEKYPAWYMVNELIRQGAPIRLKFDSLVELRDIEEEDILFDGEIQCQDQQHSYTVTLKWK